MAFSKTTCPITRDQFRGKARPMTVRFGDHSMVAVPKEFSTKSLGWNINEKLTIEVDGVAVTVQVGMNLTIVGSKELPGAAT